MYRGPPTTNVMHSLRLFVNYATGVCGIALQLAKDSFSDVYWLSWDPDYCLAKLTVALLSFWEKKKLVPLLLPRTTYTWSSMWWHVERKVRQNHKLRLEGDFVSKLFMWLWMWHRKTLWWQKSLQFVVFYLNVCMLSERAIQWCLKSCCSPGCRVAFRTRRPIQGNARVASSENKLW